MSGYKTNALFSSEGGGFLGLIDITGSPLAIPTTLTDGTNSFNLGYIKDSAPQVSSEIEAIKDETTNLIYARNHNFEYKTVGKLMQSDPDTITAMMTSLRNKPLLEIKYQGCSGGYHKIYFATVIVKSQMKDTLPSEPMDYESYGFTNKTDFTISAADIAKLVTAFPAIASLLPASPATIVISANMQCKLYTKAVA